MTLFGISNQQIHSYLPISELKLQIRTHMCAYIQPHVLLQDLSSARKMWGLQGNQRPWSVVAFCLPVLCENRAHVRVSPKTLWSLHPLFASKALSCIRRVVSGTISQRAVNLFMISYITVLWHLYLFLSQQLMQKVRGKHSGGANMEIL